MESTSRRRVLVVANRTAATPDLLEAVKRYRREQPTTFALLIPDAPRSEHTDWTLELALPLLERAAGGPVEGLTGTSGDPFDAVRKVLADGKLRPRDHLVPAQARVEVAATRPARGASRRSGCPSMSITATGTRALAASYSRDGERHALPPAGLGGTHRARTDAWRSGSSRPDPLAMNTAAVPAWAALSGTSM